MSKCQNHPKNRTASNIKKQERKINLNDIKFDENKFKKLFAARKKKRRYYDYYYSDNDNKSVDDERSESIDESSNENEQVVKKKKNIKKKTVTKTKPPPIKQKKKQEKKNHRSYAQLTVFIYFIHQIVFAFVVLIIVKKVRKKMQRQIPVTSHPPVLNPLKDMA